MRRMQPILVLAALLAVAPVLAGCENFDPDKLDVFGLAKEKKLPGKREALFPNGVPGVSQGIPPEYMKGYHEQQAAGAMPAQPGTATPAGATGQQTAAVTPVQEAKPKPEVKPKPKAKPRATRKPKPAPKTEPKEEPKTATQPAPQPAAQQPAMPPWPSAQPQQKQQGTGTSSPWPSQPPASTTTPWPSAPPPGTFTR
jgi:hypothetical protein